MKTIKQIERKFDKLFPIWFVAENQPEEIATPQNVKAFYRQAITELLEGLRVKEEPRFESNLANYLPWNEKRARYFLDGYNQCVNKINQKIDQAKGGK